jgi:predicted transcriptional regulator
MSNAEVKTTLRLSRELNERLKRIAEINRRSVHAQILIYVEDGLEVDEGGEQ